MMGVYGYVDLRRKESRAVSYDIARAELISDVLKNGLVTIMTQGRAEELHQYIETMLAEDIRAVRLIASDGLVISSSLPGEEGRPYDHGDPALEPGDHLRIGVEGNRRMYRLRTPFYNDRTCSNCHAGSEGELLCILDVTVQAGRGANMVRLVREGALHFYLFALLSMAVSLGLTTTYLVVRPLRRMRKAVREAREGRLAALDDPRSFGGGQEMRELAAEISELAAAASDRAGGLVRRHEEDLLSMRKMADVGELAASVAHEIKNPLAGISGAIEVMNEDLPPGDPKREVIAEVLGEIGRLDRTIRELLYFARPPELARLSIPARALLTRVADYLAAQKNSGAISVNIVAEEGSELYADPDQLQTALVALIRGAARAAGERKVEVSARAGELEGTVSLLIEGRGGWLSQQERENYFRPYFATANLEIGLGAAIARSIIERHGGAVRVLSNTGVGMSFEIVLPTGTGGPGGKGDV